MMYRGRGGLRLWPIVIFGIFLVYYYLAHQQEVPLTGRKQLVDISREQEVALGLQSYRQILSRARVIELFIPARRFLSGDLGMPTVRSVAW